MAIAAWKRFEKMPGWQRRKLFLKRLAGKELKLRPDLDIRSVKDGGWWFHPDVLRTDSVVYSLGVGKDVEFDCALMRRFGLEVHSFDPTPSTVEWLQAQDLPPGFHFHPWAVTAADGVLELYPRIRKDGNASTVMYTLVADDASLCDAIQVPAFSVSSILEKLGHSRIDLLKMDIEGAEYQVLDSLLQSGLEPLQLLVEFHHRFAGIGMEKTSAMIDRLRTAGYGIFAVSETGREISFMRTADDGSTQ